MEQLHITVLVSYVLKIECKYFIYLCSIYNKVNFNLNMMSNSKYCDTLMPRQVHFKNEYLFTENVKNHVVFHQYLFLRNW